MKKHHLSYIIGGILLLAFAGFSVSSFQETLTPYVSFEEAKSAGRIVQVAGGLLQDSTAYDTESESLTFELEDLESGKTLPIRYEGLRPANFEDAVSIVAIGRWNDTRDELHADKLLVLVDLSQPFREICGVPLGCMGVVARLHLLEVGP